MGELPGLPLPFECKRTGRRTIAGRLALQARLAAFRMGRMVPLLSRRLVSGHQGADVHQARLSEPIQLVGGVWHRVYAGFSMDHRTDDGSNMHATSQLPT